MKILYNALDESYFGKIISCSNANEIWIALEHLFSNQSYELSPIVDEVVKEQSHQQEELQTQPQGKEEKIEKDEVLDNQSPCCSNSKTTTSNWDDSESNNTNCEILTKLKVCLK